MFTCHPPRHLHWFGPTHSPNPEQSLTSSQSKLEQSAPVHPASHTQLVLKQAPLPKQEFGQFTPISSLGNRFLNSFEIEFCVFNIVFTQGDKRQQTMIHQYHNLWYWCIVHNNHTNASTTYTSSDQVMKLSYSMQHVVWCKHIRTRLTCREGVQSHSNLSNHVIELLYRNVLAIRRPVYTSQVTTVIYHSFRLAS